MKKLLITLTSIIVIIAIALLVFAGKMDGIVKDVIETEGSLALGSPVRVESVVTDLKEGSAIINNFTVANPAGYKAKNAIEIKSFSVSVDYRNQIINSIEIDNPIINAEQKGQINNFQDLLQNMPATEEEAVAAEEDETVITIKQLALRGATVNLITSDLSVAKIKFELDDRNFVMDDFVLNNLTGTATQISDVVVERLTSHISTQVKNHVKNEIAERFRSLEDAKDRIKENVTEKLKGLKFKFGKD
ncbi:MAG: hypothetical protein ACI854_002894 [Arenicella sp.]|jgi:hypothetical protein